MKKIIFGVTVVLVVSVISGFLYARNSTTIDELFDSDVEALTGCEITNKKGEVIYSCPGDDGKCSKTYMGYVLTCDGSETR